ncbi:MAG: DNA primase [Acidimicrobiia bacterium]
MAFDRDDIERVRDATNLVELVEAVTTVKKSGRSHKAICPFHQERSPSMSLDPARGLFHCFGCGKGGDVYAFVMESQGMDFAEAVEELARRAGITLKRDPRQAAQHGRHRRLVEVVGMAVDFYHDRLRTGVDAGAARSYLRGRGYGADVVDRFAIGFAPEEPGWHTLIDHLKDHGVTEADMLSAGVATRTQRGRLRDWFHGRLLFPIHDLKGDPVGFGGRILEGEGPKYVNSPESDVYHKAKVLYGLHTARSPMARSNRAVVVEGYTDVIACHLAGIDSAVATCGTALGEDHFDLLRRFADRVVLAFDADEAGAGAALRGGGLSTPTDVGIDLRVARMPAGRDPADLLADGEADLLRKAIDESEPFLAFQIDRVLADHDLSEVEGRTRALRAVAPLVARLDDAVARREYAREISRRTGIEPDLVSREVEGGRRGGSPASPADPAPTRATGRDRLENEALRLLALNRFGGFAVTEDHFTTEERRRVFRVLHESLLAAPNRPVDLSAVAAADPALAERLRRLTLADAPEESPDGVYRRLELGRLEREVDEVKGELARLGPDDAAYEPLSRRLVELLRERARWRES